MRDDEDTIEPPDTEADPDLADGIDPDDDQLAPRKGIDRDTPLGGI